MHSERTHGGVRQRSSMCESSGRSGSEDGTVRLWQTRVGTEYGLWKFGNSGDGDSAPAEDKA